MSLHANMLAHSPTGRVVEPVVKLLHSSEPYASIGYPLSSTIPFHQTGQVLGVMVFTLFTEVHKFYKIQW